MFKVRLDIVFRLIGNTLYLTNIFIKFKNPMKEELLENIIKLRFAVGFLIEKQKWWNTNFFSPTSGDFLNYIFPKSTSNNSNYFLNSIRHSIDSEVGANYYHLFRLPIELEEQLHKINKNFDLSLINNEETALNTLKESANNLTVERNEGPVNIGTSTQLNKDIMQAISAQYYSAFKNNYKVHPYLN